MSDCRVLDGDCREVMAGMEPESVDAIVTDPPYGLEFMGKEWDQLWRKASDRTIRSEGRSAPKFKIDTPCYEAGGAAQEWHHAWAAEALRVLKPGAHLLAFGGSRTYHRLVCAIEDAGFEIRDTICWLYGSGFPKSLDVSKAIDKRRDDNQARAIVASSLREALSVSGKSRAEIDAHFGTANVSQYWFSPEHKTEVPPADKWPWLRSFLELDDPDLDAEVWRLNGRKGQPGENWDKREVVGEKRLSKMNPYAFEPGQGGTVEVTTPATVSARKWQGWGTALKPAVELVVVARKPLIGTVAANVEAHGTGAINVDGCRIEGESVTTSRNTALGRMNDDGWKPQSGTFESHPSGRWPANVVLDEEAAAVLDEQSGETYSNDPGTTHVKADGWGHSIERRNQGYAGDFGGASRFFYCAKAPQTERERGPEGGHPTQKPVDLMRWLVRLVTPPGGTVLDPFCGSGSTGVACSIEGFGFIGIEQDPGYAEIARRRIVAAPLNLFAH